MIYITGDRHGDLSSFRRLSGEKSWGKGDILIVLGDFGFVIQGEKKNPFEKQNLDTLAGKPYEILFLDGNHEGFAALEEYPEEIRYGAPVKKLRENIFWLRRGYIYEIEKRSFFVMGGAYSLDKGFRVAEERLGGIKSWFPQELPNNEEYHRAADSLQTAGNQVDYILTHTAPATIIPRVIGKYPDSHDRELTGFLDWIYHEITFQKWYFGHLHEDKIVNDQIRCCYEEVVCLPQE